MPKADKAYTSPLSKVFALETVEGFTCNQNNLINKFDIIRLAAFLCQNAELDSKIFNYFCTHLRPLESPPRAANCHHVHWLIKRCITRSTTV